MLSGNGHRLVMWSVALVVAFVVQGAARCDEVQPKPSGTVVINGVEYPIVDGSIVAGGIDPAEMQGVDFNVEAIASEEAGPPIPCDSLTLLSITADLSKVMSLSRRCQEVTEVELSSMDNIGLMDLIVEIDKSLRDMNIAEDSGVKCHTKVLFMIPRDGSAEFGYAGLMGFSANEGVLEKVLKKEAPEILAKLEADEDGFLEDTDGTYLYRPGAIVIMYNSSRHQLDQAQLLQVSETSIRELTQSGSDTICELKFAPSDMHSRQKDSFVQQVLAAVYTDIQRRDDEPELEFRLRESYGRVMTGLIDTAFNQLEYLKFAARNSEYSGNLCWDLEIKAIPDSDLDHWIQRQAKCESRTVRSLHPNRIGFFSCSLAIPESLQATLPFLGSAISAAVQKEDLLSEAGTMELAAAFAAMAEHGVFDFMVQVVPDAERRPNFFAVMPLAESATLSTTAIELVSRIEGGDVDSHYGEVEGWTVQRLGPADSDLTNMGLAVQGTAPTDVLLLVTDRDAILHLASPDSQHLLKEIVGEKPTEAQTDDDTARFRKSGFSAQIRMADLFRTLYREEAESLLEEVYGKARMEAGNLEDGITISMFEEDHKVQIRTEFERDNIVLGAAYYVMILGIFGEMADF